MNFVIHYNQYLDELRQLVKPELIPVLDEMSEIDPHDLVRPDSYFHNENHARGFVWSLFLERTKRMRLLV